MRSYSPRLLSLITSIIITVLSFLFILTLKLVNSHVVIWWVLILVPFFVFLTSFSVIQFLLQKFIHERIKLIYRSIYDFKSNKTVTPNKVDIEQDVLSQVEKDVQLWMNDKRSEVKQQKKAELFRKEFLSNVSHELKTPIFSIEGYLETLLDGGLEDPSINVKYIERALRNTERLSEIIKDLDMISSLERDQLELDFESINLHNLCMEVVESLQLLAYNYNVTIRLNVNNDKLALVEADRHRIKQVLTNLISNSIKYGKKGGVTEIAWYEMDENLLIEVSDDGIGISKEHLARLFERFYRVDKNRSREMGGTGLGLSIVKHIIEAHDQTINVRSTVNVGSTFGFTLKRV